MDVDYYHWRFDIDIHVINLVRLLVSIVLFSLSIVSAAKPGEIRPCIISLSPNLTEILCHIGAGPQIIARDRHSNYPASIQNIPIVADYFKLNIEHILLLHPDLIVVEQSSFLAHDIAKLREKGVSVYINKSTNLASISQTMLDLGVLTGHEKLARTQALLFQKKINEYRCQHQGVKKIPIFYELWDKPLLTVGRNTTINEILTICGGVNIFADVHSDVPHVSMESVIKRNPQVIIFSQTRFNGTWSSLKQRIPNQTMIVLYISPDLIERTGPRLIEGINKVCAFLDGYRANPTACRPRQNGESFFL